MKKFAALLLPLAVAACLSPAAIAQEKTALAPLPSIDDFTKGENGWALGLGLGVEYESAYEGSDEFGFEADPAGALQWRSGDVSDSPVTRNDYEAELGVGFIYLFF